MNVGLGVISIAVTFESMLMDYVQDINSVQTPCVFSSLLIIIIIKQVLHLRLLNKPPQRRMQLWTKFS